MEPQQRRAEKSVAILPLPNFPSRTFFPSGIQGAEAAEKRFLLLLESSSLECCLLFLAKLSGVMISLVEVQAVAAVAVMMMVMMHYQVWIRLLFVLSVLPILLLLLSYHLELLSTLVPFLSYLGCVVVVVFGGLVDYYAYRHEGCFWRYYLCLLNIFRGHCHVDSHFDFDDEFDYDHVIIYLLNHN